jgi:hypothetical protein
MGMEMTTEFEKRDVNGRPVLVSTGSGTAMGDEAGKLWADFEALAKSAELAGTEKVGNRKCWVLRLDDPDALGLLPESGMEGQSFEAKEAHLFIDQEDSLLRRMKFDGTATVNGESSPVAMEITFSDYRKVEGFPYPWAMDMRMAGMESGMSEEEMEEAKTSLAELEKQLASMPEEQRKLVEPMLGGQMEKLKEMLGTGEMKMEVRVSNVVANAAK